MQPNKGQLFCAEFMEKMSAKLKDKSVLDVVAYTMPEGDNAGYVLLKGSEDDIFKAVEAIANASAEAGYKGKHYIFGGDESDCEAQITFAKR